MPRQHPGRQRSRGPVLFVLLLCAALGLGGCAFAPGGHINYETDTAPIDDLVNIEPITPGLVAAYRDALSKSGSAMPDELRTALDDYEYRIGSGDILSVIVYDHPELTIPAGAERSAAEVGNRVRRNGTIFYPYIGQVQVEGKTLDEVRTILTRRLADYITDPQVDVSVAAFRSKKVHISGAVGQPGTLPITDEPLTITDAISQVGGASQDANWHSAFLTREGNEIAISLYALLRQGDQRQNRLLRDGDVLHVPVAENQNITVMGQVRAPGGYPIGNERLNLTDAIARAGGINENSAEASGIFVIRGESWTSDKLATVYQLDVSNAASFTLGNRFMMQPQDVVYVTTAPVARWNRVISLLLPSVNLPGTLASTTTDVRDINE